MIGGLRIYVWCMNTVQFCIHKPKVIATGRHFEAVKCRKDIGQYAGFLG